MNIDSLKMATKCHEDSTKNKVLLLFAGESASCHVQSFFCQQLPSSSIFQFRGQKLEQTLVDILPSPYTLICCADQLWVGPAIDACLYTATDETFAPRPLMKNTQRSNTSVTSCT